MLQINWPQKISGTVKISGSKNAALPLIACWLFFKKYTLHNVPNIGDVQTFLKIIESLGVKVNFENNTLNLDTTEMSLANLDRTLIKKIRVGIFLFPALLKRFGELEIPYPGGCNIGKRPITEHLTAFSSFGYHGEWNDENIDFSGKPINEDIEFSAGFAVTATENAIMMASFRPQKTTIHLAAIEPHVINLIDFLRTIGVKIDVNYNHTITIEWIATIPETAETTVISDYIESGTFIIMWALSSNSSITVQNARINDLTCFIEKCREAWVKLELNHEKDEITVYNSRENLKAINIQTNIFPGFPTDLQSPFALLLTQAEWNSRIHEVLFEWRLNWLIEIEKMKWHMAILNPHEALIFGPTNLRWATVSSWDLRAGVTMILAWMIASGTTQITNVEYIERWYENIVEKISLLWWKIERI